MEDELDDIAEGGIGWTQVLHEFNEPFQRALEKAEHLRGIPALRGKGLRLVHCTTLLSQHLLERV